MYKHPWILDFLTLGPWSGRPQRTVECLPNHLEVKGPDFVLFTLHFCFPKENFDMICVKQRGTVCALLGKINIKPKQAVASLVPSPLVAALAPTLHLFTVAR